MNAWITVYLIGAVVCGGIVHYVINHHGPLPLDAEQRRRAHVLTMVCGALWPSVVLLMIIMMFEPGRYRVWKYLRGW